MPLETHFNTFLGASLLGVMAAATLYVVEHYRQERKRHAMAQDLARMDTELSVLRRELDQILSLQKDKSNKSRRVKRSANSTPRNKAASVISHSTTTEDYNSALDMDSSDLEFYDVSDDESDATGQLDLILSKIDAILDKGSALEIENCISQLTDLCLERPGDPEFLWRIGKGYHKLAESTEDEVEIQEFIKKGLEACTSALSLKPELCQVHKWLAILIGSRSDFQPMKEKIADGHLFKKHVDLAISLNPSDPPLHHMLGRFDYEIASLKWYERKVASALFGEPPNATYSEALDHFLQAEELSTDKDWKENKVCIAKCHFKLGHIEEGLDWLRRAKSLQSDNNVNKVDKEIAELLEKYDSFR